MKKWQGTLAARLGLRIGGAMLLVIGWSVAVGSIALCRRQRHATRRHS